MPRAKPLTIEAADRPRLAKLFFAKTHRKGECLRWGGAVDDRGYGVQVVEGRARGAHRVAYALANGHLPDGYVVRQRCGNRWCVESKHLELAPSPI